MTTQASTVSFHPYTDEYKARFAELAELLFECRQAFRDVAESTSWRPAPDSPAAKDIQKLSEHDPAYPQTVPPKIIMVLYFYLYAASEHLGSLYTMQEVLIAPGVLLRCVLEHCAVSMWVLQRGDGALEDRLARAYLEELASAKEAKKTSGRLLGKTADQHDSWAAQFKMLREEAELVFGKSPFDELVSLGNQSAPHGAAESAATEISRTFPRSPVLMALRSRNLGRQCVERGHARLLRSARAGCSLQDLIGEQRVDAAGDVIADRADLVKRTALGVGQVPLDVALAGDVRALIAAAHRHDDVRLF